MDLTLHFKINPIRLLDVMSVCSFDLNLQSFDILPHFGFCKLYQGVTFSHCYWLFCHWHYVNLTMDLTLLFCFPKNWCKSVIVSLFKYLFGFACKILWLWCLLWGKTGSMFIDYEALVKHFPWLLFALYIFLWNFCSATFKHTVISCSLPFKYPLHL